MSDKISVILPVYNAEEFLHDSINSVLEQSWQNWELIIVNDGSTDQSQAIIEKTNDSRIINIYQENQGVSHARNKGLDIATGDYVCFLDADDQLSSSSLEARLKIFSKSDNIFFVDGSVEIYDGQMENISSIWHPSFKGNPFNDLTSLTGKSFFGPTWMIRKRALGEVRLKESMTHAEDLLFYINLAKKGGLYDHCDEVVLKYRRGNDSAMKNLKGLEKGYKTLIEELSKMDEIPTQQLISTKKKVKNMMLKAYIKDLDLASAVSLILNK